MISWPEDVLFVIKILMLDIQTLTTFHLAMRSLTVTLLYCMPYGTAKTAAGENVGNSEGLVVGTGVGLVVGTGVGLLIGTGAIMGDLMSENNPAKEREQQILHIEEEE